VIDLLRRGERDYLAQFGATEVYLSSAGKLGTGRNLARAGPLAAAWWVRDRFTAEQVLVAIGEKQPESVEAATAAIEAAAAQLGVALYIEPDMKISRIRLSDKTSRLHPRHVVPIVRPSCSGQDCGRPVGREDLDRAGERGSEIF
jgi:hypothetical protein